MATEATLSKAGTDESVTIPILDEGGSPVVMSDFGKPEVGIKKSGGTAYPQISDYWSGTQNLTLQARYTTEDAYENAIDLADLVAGDVDPQSDEKLELDIDLPEYPNTMTVAPSAGQGSALSLSYAPGHRNNVVAELSLTRVGRIEGTSISRTIETPTDTGSGPIELRAGSETVTISAAVDVTREVGRPRDVIRRRPQNDFPKYYTKLKPISDTLTLAYRAVDDPFEELRPIGDQIFRQRLGRSGVTLDFNGIYGMGEFEVIPTGSAPFRQARVAGRQGMASVPTFEFTRIFSA